MLIKTQSPPVLCGQKSTKHQTTCHECSKFYPKCYKVIQSINRSIWSANYRLSIPCCWRHPGQDTPADQSELDCWDQPGVDTGRSRD